jgi:type II restriction/modification system DNA methylase subunit YeeA
MNGIDVTRRPQDKWIIDFGWTMSEAEAAQYEAPFEYVAKAVRPERRKNNRKLYADYWWRHVEPRPGMWAALSRPLSSYIATPRVGKHRVFRMLPTAICPDSQLIVIAREDMHTLGVVQSAIHEVWALRLGTWLGVGNDPRYTPSTTFETFPFPKASTSAVSAAADALNKLRENWLNPPELVRREPEVATGYPDRLLPRSVDAAEQLKKRTLTNLYNDRPTWLSNAHRELDRAVVAAYGWPEAMADRLQPENPDSADRKAAEEDVLGRLLVLNVARSRT